MFWGWLTNEGIEKEICLRQLVMIVPFESFWFNQIHNLIKQNDPIPFPFYLKEKHPSHKNGKRLHAAFSAEKVKKMRDDIKKNNILRYFNFDKIRMGQYHLMCATVRDTCSVYDSRRAKAGRRVEARWASQAAKVDR